MPNCRIPVSAFLLFTLHSFATLLPGAHAADLSAMRGPGESYEQARARQLGVLNKDEDQDEDQDEQTDESIDTTMTAEAFAVPEAELDLSALPDWGGLMELESRFRIVRDDRFLPSPNDEGFARRLPWLYPDDGCYARAEAAVERLVSQIVGAAPKKVFAFGALEAQSRFLASPTVRWWYHVAPAVRVGAQAYVLDPALSVEAPLRLEDWIARMSPPGTPVRIAICDTWSYDPTTPCTDYPEDSARKRVTRSLPHYLEAEWTRVITLGMDPLRVLGESPPWRD